MSDSPKPATSYIDEAIIRQQLRMKAEYLQLLALTIGVHNINNGDFAFLEAIDTQTNAILGRFKMHSNGGNPPLSQPGSGERFHAENPEEIKGPVFDNAGAQNFAAGMAEQLGTSPAPNNPFDLTGVPAATTAPAAPLAAATPLPAPPPPAAPTEADIPPQDLGAVDPAIADGLNELTPNGGESDEREFDGMVRNRGHIIRG